jgi:putative flavoprotein involved in K+ transport
MVEQVETVIVGGGQAGLATSYCLGQHGCEHVILEQAAQVGSAWRHDRWDSFSLVSPNWAMRLPGAEYQGSDPHGFMPRDQVVAALEAYAERYQMPVRCGVRVLAVEPRGEGQGYRVMTDGPAWDAHNVVMATGLFQQPRIPAASAGLGTGILQLPSGQYRNPEALPPGAVLVVGSAQSGCQIAEELYQAGRRVYVCVGSAGRVPRRYRGRDIFEWLALVGFFDRMPDKLPSPQARFAGNPHVSGKSGGHSLNLHQFARDGVTLLGHMAGARDGRIWLSPDLAASLDKVDRFEADALKLIDDYVAAQGLDAPEEPVPHLRDGYASDAMGELDLRAAGIATVIWATGYRFDFGLVRYPVVDAYGFPLQDAGVTAYPGLYFAGLPWLPVAKTGLLLGVGENASHVAEHIAGRNGRRGR